MIVGLEFGFYVPALIPKAHQKPGDPRILQVRTRRAVDLDRLRDTYLPELGETIVLPGGSDFQFRAYCTPEQWGNALLRFSLDIDYINEKNGAVDKYKDHDLYHLYEKIWSAALNCFPTGSIHDPKRFRSQKYSASPSVFSGEWKRPSELTKAEKAAARRQWDDAEPDISDIVDIENGIIWDLSEVQRRSLQHITNRVKGSSTISLEYPEEWKDSDPRKYGDHSNCRHADSKNARRRCRKAKER